MKKNNRREISETPPEPCLMGLAPYDPDNAIYLSAMKHQIFDAMSYSQSHRSSHIGFLGKKAFTQQYATIRIQFPRGLGHTTFMKNLYKGMIDFIDMRPICIFSEHKECEMAKLEFEEDPARRRFLFYTIKNIMDTREFGVAKFTLKSKTVLLVDRGFSLSKSELAKLYDLEPFFLIILE